jgi:hypothetical protein
MRWGGEIFCGEWGSGTETLSFTPGEPFRCGQKQRNIKEDRKPESLEKEQNH